MALLLNIDTATEVASVCISLHGKCVAYRENTHQKEHGTFVHAAVENVLTEAAVTLDEVEGFAVTSGPGSYTGLRVGMATAKGFCYALTKPLITVNTLEVMAQAALDTIEVSSEDLLAPMIDARRMEVFTAVYNQQLKNIVPPQPLVLEENSFKNMEAKSKIIFFGSGSAKFKTVTGLTYARFEEVAYNAENLATLAEVNFKKENFTDISYCEPNYFKDFQSTNKS